MPSTEEVIAMVYSPWFSPGFGVCGHQNQYESNVRLGNWVEDQAHVRETNARSQQKKRRVLSETKERYIALDPKRGKSKEELENEAFELLAAEFGEMRNGQAYAELFKQAGTVGNAYQTTHEASFGNGSPAARASRKQHRLYDENRRESMTVTALRNGLQTSGAAQCGAMQEGRNVCTSKHGRSYAFTKRFLPGRYLHR